MDEYEVGLSDEGVVQLIQFNHCSNCEHEEPCCGCKHFAMLMKNSRNGKDLCGRCTQDCLTRDPEVSSDWPALDVVQRKEFFSPALKKVVRKWVDTRPAVFGFRRKELPTWSSPLPCLSWPMWYRFHDGILRRGQWACSHLGWGQKLTIKDIKTDKDMRVVPELEPDKTKKSGKRWVGGHVKLPYFKEPEMLYCHGSPIMDDKYYLPESTYDFTRFGLGREYYDKYPWLTDENVFVKSGWVIWEKNPGHYHTVGHTSLRWALKRAYWCKSKGKAIWIEAINPWEWARW